MWDARGGAGCPPRADPSGGDVAVARVEEAVRGVADESGRGEPEEPGAVARARELLQRAVEADRVLRVVVERRLDDEDADQAEDDAARGMAGDAERRADLLRP